MAKNKNRNRRARRNRGSNFTAPTPKNILAGKTELAGAIKRSVAYELMCDGRDPKSARAEAQVGDAGIASLVSKVVGKR